MDSKLFNEETEVIISMGNWVLLREPPIWYNIETKEKEYYSCVDLIGLWCFWYSKWGDGYFVHTKGSFKPTELKDSELFKRIPKANLKESTYVWGKKTVATKSGVASFSVETIQKVVPTQFGSCEQILRNKIILPSKDFVVTYYDEVAKFKFSDSGFEIIYFDIEKERFLMDAGDRCTPGDGKISFDPVSMSFIKK